MKTCNVLSPFKDADGIHKPGDKPVYLADKDAEELIALGAVEEVVSAAQPDKILDDAERLAAIVSAIGELDKDNVSNWTTGGKPQIPAIQEITGWALTGKERDAAWESMQPRID